jgi:hypothetical protein
VVTFLLIAGIQQANNNTIDLDHWHIQVVMYLSSHFQSLTHHPLSTQGKKLIIVNLVVSLNLGSCSISSQDFRGK